jgi:hypothetical protein
MFTGSKRGRARVRCRSPHDENGDALSDDELVPEKIEPDAEPDVAADPDVDYGEQDEAAQEDEWQEDAQEGGE